MRRLRSRAGRARRSPPARETPLVPGQGRRAKAERQDARVARSRSTHLPRTWARRRTRSPFDTVRAVDWRDSSLGCPKPGMAYLDVITPGHRVTLRANGRSTSCTKPKQGVRLQAGQALGGITAHRELTFGKQLLEARKDLAGRLGVPEREIRFLASDATSGRRLARLPGARRDVRPGAGPAG